MFHFNYYELSSLRTHYILDMGLWNVFLCYFQQNVDSQTPHYIV